MMLSAVPMATGPVGEAPSNENQRKGGSESWMVQVVRQLVQRPWGGVIILEKWPERARLWSQP